MEKRIKDIIANRINAVKNRNVEKATKDFSENVIAYDVVGKLKFIGVKAVQNRLREWLTTLDQIHNFEIIDLKITASRDIGFCSSLNHIDAKTVDGGKLDMYWRETTCYTLIEDTAKIIHTHSSVPFDANSGKASIGLKPENVDQATEGDTQKSPSEIAKSSYIAFQNQQRNILENLFSEDFNFSSPEDKSLTKEQFFEKCYPFSKEVENYKFLKVVEDDNDVFVTYKCSAKNRPDFENTELLKIENGKIKSVKVFFGG